MKAGVEEEIIIKGEISMELEEVAISNMEEEITMGMDRMDLQEI